MDVHIVQAWHDHRPTHVPYLGVIADVRGSIGTRADEDNRIALDRNHFRDTVCFVGRVNIGIGQHQVGRRGFVRLSAARQQRNSDGGSY